MKCEKCGNEIDAGLIYCPNCGQSIQLVPNYNVLEEEMLSKIVEDKNAPKEKFAEGVYQNPEPVPAEEPKQEQAAPLPPRVSPIVKYRALIVAGVAVVSIIIIGWIIMYSVSSTQTYEYQYSQAADYEAKGAYARALEYYTAALDYDPNSYEAKLGAAKMYYEINDYDNAITLLTECINTSQDSYEAYQYLAFCYDTSHNSEDLYALYESAPTEEIRNMLSGFIVAPPTFSVEGGDYSDYVTLFLYPAEDSDQIFYTTDGKNPKTSGRLYSGSIVIKEGQTTVSAVALNSEGKYSVIKSEVYNVNYSGPSAPQVSPEGGVYTEPTLITISVPKNCSAYITFDGTDPTTSSQRYTEPIYVPEGKHILSVIIVDNHGNKSSVYKAEYTYTPGEIATVE